MSYVNPPSNKPANTMGKRGGGGMLFLLMLAAGAFLLLSNLNSVDGLNSDKPADASGASGVERGNVSGLEPEPAGKKMPTTGREGAQSGWEMDGVTHQKTNTNSGTTNGKDGWKMEEVDSNKGETGVRLSRQKKDAGNASDWDMEEVEGKKKSNTKNDWEIEEVDKR